MAMRVIGVHPVEYSERALERFVRSVLSSDADSKQVASKCDEYRDEMRTNMERLYLIEAVIEIENGEFDFGRVSQDDPQTPDGQVPFNERFLNDAGGRLVDAPDNGTARVAFFYHFLDLARPFQTADGPVNLPAPTALPERLERLMPYELP